MVTPQLQPGDPQLATKVITLLLGIPANARASFARTQLNAQHPQLVQAFDRIPRSRRQRSVLFASFTPHFRETRLAAAARLAGWDTYSVCQGKPKYNPTDYFSLHFQMDDPIKFVLVCWLFPGALVHAFALNGEHAILLSWLKPHRLVVDLYDTSAGCLKAKPGDRQLEREVIASADGITHRDVRIKRLQRLHGYKLPKRNLFIHDPLPENPPAVGKLAQDGEIHVVSSGWVGSGDNSVIRTARALCSHGIHLHVYFNPFQQGRHPDTQCYWDLQAQSPYFHIEKAVYGDEYWTALRQYDFGLSILEPALFGEPIANYTADALAGCGSSRLSDYIAADLGIIVSPELRFQHFWSRHFAATTVTATGAFLQDPLPVLRQALRAKAHRPPVDRSAITIKGAATRLGEFYRQLADPQPIPFGVTARPAPATL